MHNLFGQGSVLDSVEIQQDARYRLHVIEPFKSVKKIQCHVDVLF